MPTKYLPFEIGIDFQTSNSGMVSLNWKKAAGRTTAGAIIADFRIPNDAKNLIRVEFDSAHVVRILDEMPLSTEEPLGEGLVPEHFAYRVVGAKFWESQSEALKLVFRSVEHYRFITGWTCLDVIAEGAPRISVVPVEGF